MGFDWEFEKLVVVGKYFGCLSTINKRTKYYLNAKVHFSPLINDFREKQMLGHLAIRFSKNPMFELEMSAAPPNHIAIRVLVIPAAGHLLPLLSFLHVFYNERKHFILINRKCLLTALYFSVAQIYFVF